MAYFRTRNNLKSDYSGFQEASLNLRDRLLAACKKYLADEYLLGAGQRGYWVGKNKLQYELRMNLGNEDIDHILSLSTYDHIFEAIEIYCSVAHKTAVHRYYKDILPDLQRAFNLSGAVYFLSDEGEVNLRVDEDTAKNVANVIEILEKNPSALASFKEAVGDLFGRKRNSEDIISDIFVACEDYLKSKTGEKEFGKAVASLSKKNVINKTQAALLNKISAFRSDVYGVAHAGDSSAPDESDALWFLETVVAQIKIVERKLKDSDNSGGDRNEK